MSNSNPAKTCRSLACKRVALFALMVFSIVGCASASFTIKQPASQKLSDFDALVIKDFVDLVGSEDSAEVVGHSAMILKEKIEQLLEKNPEMLFFRNISLNKIDTPAPLVLSCAVSGYQKGERLLRLLVPSVGKATAALQCKFTTAEDKIIAEVDLQGELGAGVLGGSAVESLGATLEEIIRYIQLNY